MLKKNLKNIIRAIVTGLLLIGLTVGIYEKNAYMEAHDYWVLTQYEDKSGKQGLFYTLYNEGQDSLIVIDGGNWENADYLKEVILSYGGHVDAWFISHFHADHVGAFNALSDMRDGISIDEIYVSPFDYDTYMDTAKDWDDIACYGEFLYWATVWGNVNSAYRDEVIEFPGLSCKIMNCYDEVALSSNAGDFHNNGCLVLKFESENDSVLFMGDCHCDEIFNTLKGYYGSEFSANLVQVGHHGNGGVNDSQYDDMIGEIALFDSPSWLMEDDSYHTKDLWEHLGSIGIECYDYSTAPNTFILEN